MKPTRHNKVLGLAIADRSIFVAEVAAGDPPEVRRLAEFAFPPALSLAQPIELGTAFGHFLKEHAFSTRSAVAGIPAKWLAVKNKQVPPTDDATLANLLRLQAEADFSTELKDLVYDFTAADDASQARSVLLMALPRKHIEMLDALCDAARVHLLAVVPSALVLSDAMGQLAGQTSLVLATSESGAELTLHHNAATSVVRHLRAPLPEAAFYSDVRRAIATLSNGSSAGSDELILWDAGGVDAGALGKSLGVAVRPGDLRALGVDPAPASSNGEGQKFGPAVALGLAGIGAAKLSVDFLHSRLAPPKESRLPRWSVLAGIAAGVVIITAFFAYNYLQNREQEVADMQKQHDAQATQVQTAQAFVDKVSFAQNWHGGDPRYLKCIRDLTNAMPEDGLTYATNLTLRDTPQPAGDSSSATRPSGRPTLTGKIDGKTLDLDHAVKFRVGLLALKQQFPVVELANTTDNPRTHQVTFSITFVYAPDAK